MQEINKIKDKVLHSIESGKLTMRPRWYFVLMSALYAAGGVLLGLALLYVSSFIVFAMNRSGLWFAPGFGPRAFAPFLLSLPWIMIAVAVLFIVLLEVVVRKYSFGFRTPLLYSALAIILIAVVGGFFIAQTPLHERYSGRLYRTAGPKPENIRPCVIEAVTDIGFVCINPDGERIAVAVSPDTRLPQGEVLVRGAAVVVFGRGEQGLIQARGVRVVNRRDVPRIPGERPLPPRLGE
jgi:hypothetical protein